LVSFICAAVETGVADFWLFAGKTNSYASAFFEESLENG
jgi:hypothetical protein